MLKAPREKKDGLAGKRGPNFIERVITRKAKPSKFQRDLQKELRKTGKGVGKAIKDIYNGKDDGF